MLDGRCPGSNTFDLCHWRIPETKNVFDWLIKGLDGGLNVDVVGLGLVTHSFIHSCFPPLFIQSSHVLPETFFNHTECHESSLIQLLHNIVYHLDIMFVLPFDITNLNPNQKRHLCNTAIVCVHRSLWVYVSIVLPLCLIKADFKAWNY